MIKVYDPNQRQEYEALLTQVCEEAHGTGERVHLMERYVNDAIQSHREWAFEVSDSARRAGFAGEIKAFLKRSRIVVNIEDRKVSKPRTIGTKRRSDTGQVVDYQLPFAVLTFDEIREKRREYLRQIKSYSDNLALMDRLLALAEMAPGADTPTEAAQVLGLTLDDFLAA